MAYDMDQATSCQARPLSLARYERHIELKNMGEEGQRKLLASKVLVVGAGGTGCPLLLYLAGSGIGKITIADDDTVFPTNLHRQILYKANMQGEKKALIAAGMLKELNPHVDAVAMDIRVTNDNAEGLISAHDIIIDCSDNFETRYTLNKFALKHGKTLVSGSVIYYGGQVQVFKKGAPCYECLYSAAPDNSLAPQCTDSAVLGPVAGVIGTMMAIEVIKEILKIGESLAGYFLTYNSLTSELTKIAFKHRPDCSVCSSVE